MIKIVIFDFFGVIRPEALSIAYKETQRKFGVDWQNVKSAFNELEPDTLIDKIDMQEFWRRFGEKLNIKDLRRLKSIWKKAFMRKSKVNKIVIRTIEQIKNSGHQVVLLSNSLRSFGEFERRRGHYRYFQKVFLSYGVGLKKPDESIFKYVVEKLDAKPDECLFIDDRERNVEAAKKFGMKTILFKNSNQLKTDLKQYL